MDRVEAEKASRNGAIAAAISAGITLMFAIYAMRTEARQGVFGELNDPLVLVDVALIAVCAIGMLRKSRAAAVTIFIYFIFSKIYMTVATGQFGGLPLTIVFLYFYGKAIQGTFTWHKIRKSEDENYRAAPRWLYWTGIPLIVLLFIAFGFGILTMTDAVPSTEVLTGGQVPEKDRALLIEHGALYGDERIEFFYSYGLVSVLEGGSILTNRAVVMYYTDDNDEVQAYEMTFPEIDEISLVEPGGTFSDAYYRVSSGVDDDWIEFALSTEAGGHEKFINALERARVRSLSNKPKSVPNVVTD